MTKPAGCRHTIHAVAADGRTTGTWVVKKINRKGEKQRRRVVCGVCGKFYGYLPDAIK